MHRIGGWEGSRAGLDMGAKRKIPDRTGNQTLVFQPIATHFTKLTRLIIKSDPKLNNNVHIIFLTIKLSVMVR
jgi:hypothetical protein